MAGMGDSKKRRTEQKDDSLFGLLSMYKAYNTYIRVLVSEDDNLISVQLTDNPSNWHKIPDERYENYRPLSRLELGSDKLSIKYITPEYIVDNLGIYLNMKIPPEDALVSDWLDPDGLFLIDISLRHRKKVITSINKILSMSPQKKYEMIEKSIAEKQED